MTFKRISKNILAVVCDQYEYDLINDLLQSYNLYARPSKSFKKQTNVDFHLSLSQITDVVSSFIVILLAENFCHTRTNTILEFLNVKKTLHN